MKFATAKSVPLFASPCAAEPPVVLSKTVTVPSPTEPLNVDELVILKYRRAGGIWSTVNVIELVVALTGLLLLLVSLAVTLIE